MNKLSSLLSLFSLSLLSLLSLSSLHFNAQPGKTLVPDCLGTAALVFILFAFNLPGDFLPGFCWALCHIFLFEYFYRLCFWQSESCFLRYPGLYTTGDWIQRRFPGKKF